MELKVVNALSRDVEREQLNKILKYLHDSIISSAEGGVTEAKVAEMIARASSLRPLPSSSSPATITVSLTGDVEGTGQGTSSITVPVNITKDLVEEAPIDSGRYWRHQGGWETVPFPLLSLAYMSPSGFGAYNEDDLEWNSRELEGDSAWTTVENGDGVSGNPKIIFTEAAKEGYKRIQGVATESIHGGRAVVFEDGNVRHPDLGDISDSVKIAGIAMNAGGIGDLINVQTGGTFREPSWNWLSSPVFVEDEGVLTQTAPTTGYVVSIGRSVDSTTIDIDVSLPLLRN